MTIEERLNEIVGDLGPGVTHIEELKRLSGGANQEIWSFFACGPDKRQRLILRRSPFVRDREDDIAAVSLRDEARILRQVNHPDIPAPKVIYIPEEDDPLGESYIMTALEGETIPRKIFRDEEFAPGRDNIASQCGTALANLHKIDTANMPSLAIKSVDVQLGHLEQQIVDFDIHRPVFELALKWLKDNAPTESDQDLCFVHGDFRMGNLMIDRQGLAGILDWELCHIANPREDIGFLCVNSWRFGNRDKRVGGVGHLPELLDAYHAAGGIEITESEIDFWDLYGSLKWGIICVNMYQMFKNGDDPSIERGSIGRRASETEIDLLNILETI